MSRFLSTSRFDFLLILSTFGCVVLGIFTIYSSGNFIFQAEVTYDSSLYLRQIYYLIPGVILLFVLHFVNYQRIAKYSLYLYFVALILLVAVLIFGKYAGGSKSWFGIGDIGIQPSEICKLIYIIAFATFLERLKDRIAELKYFLLSFIAQSPIIFLILLQPDPGTVLVYSIITFGMLFVSNANIRYILTLLGIFVIALTLGIVGIESDYIKITAPAEQSDQSTLLFFSRLFIFLHEYINNSLGILITGASFLFVFLLLQIVAGKGKMLVLFFLAVIEILFLLLYLTLPDQTIEEYKDSAVYFLFSAHGRSFIYLNLIPLLLSLFIFQFQEQQRIRYIHYIKLIYLTYGLGLLLAMFIVQANEISDSKLIKPHIVDRFTSFLGLTEDYQDIGYDTRQNILAVGSGGIYGQGFALGPHSHGYVTERSTDYAFTVFAEDMGFLWVLVLFALFGMIFFRGVIIAFNSKDYLGSLIATGIVTMFVTHFFINIGMCVGIMPIIGIPLFFISYGGSSLITGLAAVGILLNIEFRQYYH